MIKKIDTATTDEITATRQNCTVPYLLRRSDSSLLRIALENATQRGNTLGGRPAVS
jgi:hypothetical protein